ncbi:unnamed protein product [Sympodiomycopsis kandeliae]
MAESGTAAQLYDQSAENSADLPRSASFSSKRRSLTDAVRNKFKHSRTTSRGSIKSSRVGTDPRRQSVSSVASADEPEAPAEPYPQEKMKAPQGPNPTSEQKTSHLDDEKPVQSHALQAQIPLILISFVSTGAVALVLSYFHWSLGWLVLLVGSHILWKVLAGKIADEEFTARQAAANKQWDEAENSETVQWMNSILSSVWPLINNEVFVPFVDLLEDALQMQVPGIVHAVRVEDLDQGVVPLTVNSLKVLPPEEEAFLGSQGVASQKKSEQQHADHDNQAHQSQAEVGQEVDLGEHVNLEISFSYRAPNYAQRGPTVKSNNAQGSEAVGQTDQQHRGSNRSGHTPTLSQYFSFGKGSAHQSGAPAETIHMLLYLAIGLQKIAAVEVPVWVEMIGIEGKMRLRLQLVPSTPFVKHVGFTLLDQPKLEMKAKPLGRRMAIDAMNLPLLSSYVLKSVQTTVAPFVAPGSYTIDVGGLLGSGDGPTNAYSLGVICVVLHSASDLPAADTNGYADPFVSISFARAGKPLFRTRVLVKTKNPVWQEVAYILVSPDEVRDHDRLRLTAFDADRFSADDPLGKVEISVDRLISKCLSRGDDVESCSAMELREDPLVPMNRGEKTQGTLKYSITFSRLVLPPEAKRLASNPTRAKLMRQAAERAIENNETEIASENDSSLQNSAEETVTKEPHDPNAPSVEYPESDFADCETPFDSFVRRLGFPLDEKVMKARQQRKQRVKRLTDMLSGEQAAILSPPSPDWPAGILAFHIHSIQGLEVTRTQRSFKASNLAGGAGKSQATTEDPTNEGSGSLPSSYVQVFLNDEPTLRTRTKKYDPRPFINAGSERFVSDWRTARVDLVVRDSRQRESDAVLGVVGLKVADVLSQGARKSGWYTLTGGLGFGKMQVTLLWRSTHLPIPRALSGWNVGVIEIGQLSAEVNREHFEGKDTHFTLHTNGGKSKTGNMVASDDEMDDNRISTYKHDTKADALRIPIRQRYPGEVIITLKVSARSAGRHRARAIAVVPLYALQDNLPHKLRIPLYVSNDWMHVEQSGLKALVKDSNERILPQSTHQQPAHHHYHTHTKALEQVCSPNFDALPEVLTSNDGDYHTAQLQRAGFLDICIHFFPGVANEHRAILAGDHELRFAYEAWQALVDCGERARAMTIKRWNRQSRGKSQPEAHVESSHVAQGKMREKDFTGIELGQDSPGHDDLAVDQDQDQGDYEPSIIASSAGEPLLHADGDDQEGLRRIRDDEDESSVSSVDSSGEGGEDDSESIKEDRRARRRTMHRQERGAAQVKSVRTLSWLKQNLQDGMDRVGRNVGSAGERYGSSQRRRVLGKMENEGVSKF